MRQHQGHGAAIHRLDRASQKALFYIFNEARGGDAGGVGLVFNPLREKPPADARPPDLTPCPREGSVFAILRPIAQIIEYYPRCIRLVWDAAGLHAILAVGVSMLGAVVPAAQVWITKIVIDSVVSAVDDGGGAAVDWGWAADTGRWCFRRLGPRFYM